MKIFQLVVGLAIVLVLIFLALNLFETFSFEQEITDTIRKQLNNSQVVPGKIFSEEISIQANQGISTKNFETNQRLMSFECNNPTQCCSEGEQCDSGAIEWNSFSVFFSREKKLRVGSRCDIIAEKFVCKTFFGDTPAQLEIGEVFYSEEYDVKKEVPKIGLTVKNVGGKPSFFPLMEVRVFEIFFQDEKEDKTQIDAFSYEIEKIDPGITINTEVEVPINHPAKLELEIIAKENNSGFDTKIIRYNTIKTAGNCRANTQKTKDLFWLGGETCGEKHYCLECELGFECLEAWGNDIQDTLQIGNSEFAYKEVFCDDETVQGLPV